MNYPIWSLYYAGGGFLIALISVIHVYVAHFAVGGGAFLVLTEMKAYREESAKLLDYVKAHSKFFLLLTIVFGSVTGVGIWFTISLFQPQAVSLLIHQFVFAWASEWVCFIGEILAIFIYYYQFNSMSRKNHLIVGWLYFIFAWLSLFIINGIIDFMLTPGAWIQTRSFWDAFFNPTFWPALFFRTAMALNFAGIFGILTASLTKDPAFSKMVSRYCAKWLIFPFILMGVTLFWYLEALPEGPKEMILQRSPEIARYLHLFTFIFPALLVVSLFTFIHFPRPLRIAFSFLLVITGLSYIGGFEWIRESARKPYIIYNHMYANAIFKGMEQPINNKGILNVARWSEHRSVTPENVLLAGRRIFEIQCLSCHSIGGPLNDILPLTKDHTRFSMNAKLSGLGKRSPYMPPFMGTKEEKNALSLFLTQVLHGKTEAKQNPIPLKGEKNLPLPFDETVSQYVLLAFSEKGMHTISDADEYFSFSPPSSTVFAQLIQRGELPSLIQKEVVLTYAVDSEYLKPSKRSNFWKFGKPLTGKSLEKDKGLKGFSLEGEMVYDEKRGLFTAPMLPVIPQTSLNRVMPYPVVTITAKEKKSRRMIASTRVVLPVSNEWGCNNCHGKNKDSKTGIDMRTAENILIAHDRLSRTSLNKMRKKGEPQNCRSCHSTGNKSTPLNLSASIHGFHSVYLQGKGSEACNTCHPSSSMGSTRMLRGIHQALDMTCISCHGSLEDLSLSLLLEEKKNGKKNAVRLMKHIDPVGVSSVDQLKPREPHVNLPDCLHCHAGFNPPDTDEIGVNQWVDNRSEQYKNRVDETGIYCSACHGSAHAVYPTQNPYENFSENIQPMQYQKNSLPIGANKNCAICHTIEMTDELHHPNSLRLFRNSP